MPKATRARTSIHAKPLRRTQVNRDEPSVDDLPSSIAPQVDAMHDAQLTPRTEPTKKKEKQLLKHERFLQRLEASRSPYSKSHERRLKRKAKDQVANGLDEIKAAISAVEMAEGLAPAEPSADGKEAPRKPKSAPGQIGEGKHTPLSRAQRKKTLAMERMRIPKILSTSEFSSNPFQTIRKHAENTLVKHETPK